MLTENLVSVADSEEALGARLKNIPSNEVARSVAPLAAGRSAEALAIDDSVRFAGLRFVDFVDSVAHVLTR